MISNTGPAGLALSRRDLGHLKYLQRLAGQPPDSWDGFYRTPSEGMNFGLRFQIAFMGYAAFALARQTPAFRAPYADLLRSLIERMTRPEVFEYWLRGTVRALPMAPDNAPRQSPGAIEFAHNRLGLRRDLPTDPCLQGNIQYSAHLASLVGFYEMLTGDTRYDTTGLTLTARFQGQNFEFHYTHTSLAERIYRQMDESHFGGACCEPGRAYAACNNHACISNVLHDHLHHTGLSAVNARWANWVEKHLLTGGIAGRSPFPAPNGLLSMAYMPDLHLPVPVSFNLTDAWGLAFMAAWEDDMVQQIYPRFRRRLKKGPDGTLYLGSRGPNQSVEISNTGLNTAFAALLAREMGDTQTATRLLEWADLTLNPLDDPRQGRFYSASPPQPYITALLALAQTLPETGGGLHSLLSWRPDFEAPYLAAVRASVSVSQADWANRQLVVTLEGPPGELAELQFENCPFLGHMLRNGQPIEPDEAGAQYQADRGRLTLKFILAAPQTTLTLVF